MTPEDALKKITDIISDRLGANRDLIIPEADLKKDLLADSLDFVEIIMDVEWEFGIYISDKDAERLETVQQLADYAQTHDRHPMTDTPDTRTNSDEFVRQSQPLIDAIPVSKPFVLQADAPPPPAPTPETDAVNADDRQSLLEHARRLERQRDSLRNGVVQAFSAYVGASETARVTLGVVKASLQKGLHHSRPALEQTVVLCEEQLDNISKGLTPP